jgi:hypothetical protein
MPKQKKHGAKAQQQQQQQSSHIALLRPMPSASWGAGQTPVWAL